MIRSMVKAIVKVGNCLFCERRKMKWDRRHVPYEIPISVVNAVCPLALKKEGDDIIERRKYHRRESDQVFYGTNYLQPIGEKDGD